MRPLWSGTISFGLVNVPVNVFPANRSRRISLRTLAPDGTPLQRRYYCPEDGEDVPPEHLVRGYRLDSGDYVVIEDEELDELQPQKSREIDLRRFVDAAAIHPRFFERGYWLAPAGDTSKAYRLLAQAMEETARAGIATFVMRGKEYLVAVMADDGMLRAETLRFHDEVRTPRDVGLPEEGHADPGRVKAFRQAIASARVSFAPDELRDEYAEALEALAEEKAAGGNDVVRVEEKPEARSEEEGGAVVLDLLESIRRSMKSAERGDGETDAEGTRVASRGSRKTNRSREDKEADMPDAWTRKDERKYEHIKDSAQDRGKSASRAKEIAARTVNKDRREEGRTPNKKTQGTGNPNTSLDDRTKDELYNLAQQQDIEGRSKMSKKELISAIRSSR